MLTPLFEVPQVEEQTRVSVKGNEVSRAIVKDMQAGGGQSVHLLQRANGVDKAR